VDTVGTSFEETFLLVLAGAVEGAILALVCGMAKAVRSEREPN